MRHLGASSAVLSLLISASLVSLTSRSTARVLSIQYLMKALEGGSKARRAFTRARTELSVVEAATMVAAA